MATGKIYLLEDFYPTEWRVEEMYAYRETRERFWYKKFCLVTCADIGEFDTQIPKQVRILQLYAIIPGKLFYLRLLCTQNSHWLNAWVRTTTLGNTIRA
jgi:hypothetical protein